MVPWKGDTNYVATLHFDTQKDSCLLHFLKQSVYSSLHDFQALPISSFVFFGIDVKR